MPRTYAHACRGRKHYTSPGWEGSSHEASILADSLARSDGLKIPEGKFFLGDARYLSA
jgi:hypothetical protein